MFYERYNTTDLPEFWITDDGHKVSAPTWEAMAPCYMVMTSAETGQTGPTMVAPGEIFTNERAPSFAWQPLNKAAGENYDRWLDSLPVDGKGVSQELITEAAYTLRPREGDPEFTHEVWWSNVMRLAVTLHEKRRGSGVFNPTPASAYRPGSAASAPVMSYASSSNLMAQPGQPPAGAAMHQPQNAMRAAQAQRRRNVTPPMTNAPPAQGPQAA